MEKRAVAALAAGLFGVVLLGGAARAQGVDCGAIQKTLTERKDIVARVNAASKGKNKLTAAQACSLFTRLQANGNEGLKWISANKDWCSIPDSFAEGFKADHTRVGALRGKICGAAQQQAVMEKRARAQAENSGGGLLGGPGLTGSFKLPQGAL
ncbi:hypothetical protein QA634_11375 [Methylobacterium sp. CB376]|uniref:hypothetical protein n=1 Tax=unclassified Methylobacterium TaxID=2615210 RepID=UPI00031F89E4|nr:MULTISPECIES: hypothetical protein [Methylobacterium]WFT82406.1 hypothetical protein QA634_11375 [Methylobacterium nodulans]